MTILFVTLVFGLAFLGLVNNGFAGIFVGALVGFVLWCVCGIFWLVDTAYDCAADRNDGTYYSVEEKCE